MAELVDLLNYVLNPPPGDGSLTARGDQLNAGVASNVSQNSPILFVDAFGPTGSSDDSAGAINAAAAALPQTGNTFTSGGRLLLTPNKTYTIQSPIVADSLQNVVLGVTGAPTGGARILAGSSLANSSTSLISARSTKGFTIEKGVVVQCTGANYSGRMIDLRTLTSQININNTDRASVQAVIWMQVQAGSTALGVDLQNAQACDVFGWITGGGTGIQGMASNADFSNSNRVGGYFQNQDIIALHNLGFACQASGIFEPLRSGAAGAYLQDAAVPASALRFKGVSCQDVSGSNGGNWFTINGQGIAFEGGGIVTSIGSGSTVKGIVTNGNTGGLSAHGVDFSNLAFAFDPSTGTNGFFDIGGNSYNNTTVMNGNNFAQGSRVEGVAAPKVAITITATGWANAGGSQPPLTAWKDGNGVVHVEGYVTPQAGYGTNVTLATMPAGLRPGAQVMLGGSMALSGGLPTAPFRVDVTAAGAILAVGPTGAATIWISGEYQQVN